MWDSERVPDEWKKAIIVPIHKKKDKMDCNNYRGVSILCHCSKVYSNILLRRMRKRTDEILAEEQAGFRAQRNTTEQIFVLRQVVEKYTEMNKDLFVGYIDFRKAFDSIWRRGLWRVMRNLGFAEKLVKILENMYEGTYSAVRSSGGLSEWFETIVGVKQGCILSPLLFNIFLEAIMSQALRDGEEGAVIGGYLISNLRFADDIAGLGETREALDRLMCRISLEAEKLGMSVNVDKTEVQCIGQDQQIINVAINGKKLNQVEEFVYLGGVITSEGKSDKDVKRRIGFASGVMSSLKVIWQARDISLGTKVMVYESLVLSLLLYNSETWTLREDTKQRLRVFEMGCLRRILGVTRRDRIRNAHVRERLNLSTDIVQRVAERRLRFFGHVVRMPAHRLPLVAIQGQVHGKRSRGRPQKRWIDNVKEDVTTMGISLVEAFRLTQDREGWRSLVRLSMRAQASPGH